ncbi:MAG TPA: nucleoside monophosphate kinase [Candidatus Binatia bacterium]|nr:nucleoside monophosphate kinase [Candidatus Binatia bacterium]
MGKLGFDLILLGAPAAGKDTQAELLSKKYIFQKIESGKHWRKMAGQKNSTGRLLRQTFSKGNPAPVKLMKEFLVKELRKAKQNNNLLFIGNPRLKPEAQLLIKMLKAKGRDFFVINIDLPVAEIKSRSIKRMRDDQDWKYIDNRIKMYRLQVQKTLNYFKSLNKLKVVDGNQTVKKVAQDIQKVLNDYQRFSTARNTKKERANTR